jgi:cytochrome b561
MNATPVVTFNLLSRVLHWTMAVLILAMLFLGVGMVASLSPYHRLVSLHEKIGVLILVLAAIRLINRLLRRTPPLPAQMPRGLQGIAHVSHYVLYFFMFAQPLLGWAMLSAARYPLPLNLPDIMPYNVELYATLRHAHGFLGLLFFVTILMHLAAALMHALIYRDGVFASMAGRSH